MATVSILAYEDICWRFDLAQSLMNREGVDVRTASSGWALLLEASRRPPDLLLLDHWMPDMLGDDVLEQLRRQASLKSLMAVVLCPGLAAEARQRYENLPPVLLLAEPPPISEFQQRLFSLLQLASRAQMRVAIQMPVVIVSGGRRFSGQTRELSLGGASLRAPASVPAGERIEIVFPAEEGGAPLARVQGRVRHAAAEGSQSVWGVEFQEPDAEARAFLEKVTRSGCQLRRALERMESLPALPPVAARVLEVCLDEKADLGALVDLIRSDPALTSNVLKMANRAVYRTVSPVTTVERAAAVMGTRAVRYAVLGITILRHVPGHGAGEPAYRLWRHSLACALTCEALAGRYQLPADEAFVWGLLHDVGRFPMLEPPAPASPGAAGRRWTLERERLQYGVDHAEVGALLLSRWRVPPSIWKVVRQHHAPDSEPDECARRAAQLVAAADALTYQCHLGVENGLNDGESFLGQFLPRAETEALASGIYRRLAELGDMFGQPVEPSQLCAEIVERANQRLAGELGEVLDRYELLKRAYERTRQQLVSLVQSEKYHSLGRIAGAVAHEINNPLAFARSNLTSLQEYLQALDAEIRRRGPLPPETEELLADVPKLIAETVSGLDRVHGVVRALANLAPDGQPGFMEEADLRACLEDALCLAFASRPTNVEVDLHAEELPPLWLDPGNLARAFVEIILNAFHAMPGGGRLDIRLRRDGDEAVAAFRDSGQGIREDELRHLFEPFYTTRPMGEGRGLGLSMAWGIVSRHHGRIQVHSTPGQGTVVEVRLPVRSKP